MSVFDNVIYFASTFHSLCLSYERESLSGEEGGTSQSFGSTLSSLSSSFIFEHVELFGIGDYIVDDILRLSCFKYGTKPNQTKPQPQS